PLNPMPPKRPKVFHLWNLPWSVQIIYKCMAGMSLSICSSLTKISNNFSYSSPQTIDKVNWIYYNTNEHKSVSFETVFKKGVMFWKKQQ
ncbi:MAG: hypothetical protein IJD37_00350, partial [Clostridia bacterium]|nr:hypothetical protein [Clostridia bacterium]